MRLRANISVVSAVSTRWPLIMSSTSRAFCGDTRVNRAFAVNSIKSLTCLVLQLLSRCAGARPLSLLLSARWQSRRLGRGFRGRFHRGPLELAGLGGLHHLACSHLFSFLHAAALI